MTPAHILRGPATELYWVVSGEVRLLDLHGSPAGCALPGDLLGAADLFPPSPAAAWTFAAADGAALTATANCSDGGPDCRLGEGSERVWAEDPSQEAVGPFRARTGRARVRTELLELTREDLFGVVRAQVRCPGGARRHRLNASWP